jgi:hypothetical protein
MKKPTRKWVSCFVLLNNFWFGGHHRFFVFPWNTNFFDSWLFHIQGISNVKPVGEGWLLEGDADIDLRKLFSQKAQKEGWLILTLKLEKKSLETVFKELTNR